LSQPVNLDTWPVNCTLDHAALTAKYQQYKERLYRHFIVVDRDPITGCIFNGIDHDGGDPCEFSVSGFSLPASSINLARNGGWGLGERNNGGLLSDPDCGGSVSWNDSNHNYLEMGSETPTQLGWYWIMLATEYELLGRNHQYEAQKKTLEDLFLALQAYRRLDMKANCIVAEMYKNRTNGEIICDDLYRQDISDPTDISDLPQMRTFDTDFRASCSFSPDLSGYSGFFIREDATQGLETTLHDPSEDQYNIDMVSSAYALGQKPPCVNPVDEFCWLARQQSFLSQDQITSLLYGISFINKYIPADATITTCGDATPIHVLDIAKKISNGLVTHVWNDPGLAITIPGTFDCTITPIHLSEAAGGQCFFTATGMLNTNTLINGYTPINLHNNYWGLLPNGVNYMGVFANIGWNAIGASTLGINGPKDLIDPLGQIKVDPTGEGFWLQYQSMNRDLSNYKWRDLYVSAIAHYDKEIYLLGNDLLFPNGTPISDKIDGKERFKNMLCDAPCNGPCRKPHSYGSENQYPSVPDFDCPNTPNWQGDRWDGLGADFDDSDDVIPKISNGLDYMVLYNMYSLMYEQDEPFYNPYNVDRAGDFPSPDLYVGDNKIVGPNILCLNDDLQTYLLTPSYTPSTFENISWYSSPNINVVNTLNPTTTAKIVGLETPSYIGVKFNENRLIQQYYDGTIKPFPAAPTTYGMYKDVCSFDYRKSVTTQPHYMITTNFRLCAGTYYANAEGIDDPDATYSWKFDDLLGNYYDITGYGKEVTIVVGSTNQQSYGVEVTLTVTDDCGTRKFNTTLYGGCGYGLEVDPTLYVSPNPGKDFISIGFIGESYQIPNGGVQIKITNLSTPTTEKTEQIFSNPSMITTSGLKQGSYQVRAQLREGVFIETKLIISRE
jgi:hypothetical protein